MVSWKSLDFRLEKPMPQAAMPHTYQKQLSNQVLVRIYWLNIMLEILHHVRK